jgi:hypothetical protein
MKMNKQLKTRMSLAASMGTLALAATSANATIILADDFAGVGKSGNTATIGAWDTVFGISAPSNDLTFDHQSGGSASFFLVGGAGEIRVNSKMNNGGWETSLSITVGGGDIDLTSLDLDYILIDGAGNDQASATNKTGRTVVDFGAAGSATLGLNGYTNVSPDANVYRDRDVDLTGITLLAGQTYTMNIATDGGGDGHHKGLNGLVLNGTVVPEPSSAALLGLGGLALMFRRRK